MEQGEVLWQHGQVEALVGGMAEWRQSSSGAGGSDGGAGGGRSGGAVVLRGAKSSKYAEVHQLVITSTC